MCFHNIRYTDLYTDSHPDQCQSGSRLNTSLVDIYQSVHFQHSTSRVHTPGTLTDYTDYLTSYTHTHVHLIWIDFVLHQIKLQKPKFVQFLMQVVRELNQASRSTSLVTRDVSKISAPITRHFIGDPDYRKICNNSASLHW